VEEKLSGRLESCHGQCAEWGAKQTPLGGAFDASSQMLGLEEKLKVADVGQEIGR
jgi:hypothetical protein